MIGLTVTLLLVSALLVTSVYLLGFRLGRDQSLSELARVRSDSAHAERRLHELTRQAFVAMAEEVERRQGS